jgi:uncharacterized protein YyaL (SSP411 family)
MRMLRLALFLSLVGAAPASAATWDATRVSDLCAQVAASYDSGRGGFVTKDGAPVESAVELGFALGRELGDPLWTARARQTVTWTLGLYDSTGGGFFNRTRDADPRSVSFEKWTVPNAERLENLLDAWAEGGNAADRAWAVRIADYFERVLVDPRGGFVAGQMGDRDLVPEVNGIAIHAWLRFAGATASPRARDFALKSLDRVWETCWDPEVGLQRRGTFGELREVPLLEDQVQMGRAFVLGAHFGGREVDLQRAKTIGNLVLERFQEPDRGTFASQATGARQLKIKRSGRDLAENAHAVRFLAELASVAGEARYREAALLAGPPLEKDLDKAGASAADWALALRAIGSPDLPPRPKWQETATTKKPEPQRVWRGRRPNPKPKPR